MAVGTVLDVQDGGDPILTRIVEEDKVPWYRKPNLRVLYFYLFFACMGVELTSGFDSQMLNALQLVPAWKEFFHKPAGATRGIITASYSLGAILSLPLVPVVNERLGRRWSIFLGSWVMVLGSIVQCTSRNTGQYIASRIMLGFGIPTCIIAGSALIGELGYPKERATMTSLFNTSYFIGQIAAAAIVFGTNKIAGNWSWRLPSLLQAFPSVLQIIFVWFLPESPRFLIANGKAEEARAILRKYHSDGPNGEEFVTAEIAQIETTIQLELENSKRSWADLFRTAGKRRRLAVTGFLGLATQWSGNTLISYYLGDILNMIGRTNPIFQQKLNIGLSVWAGLVAFIAALCVSRFRRRAMYLTCTISLLTVYISWTISAQRSVAGKLAGTPNEAANIAVIFFIFAYSPCYNIGYNALTYTYMVELWPFAERSRGITFFQLFGRLAGFFTTFVNPIGMDNLSWKYLITYCCFLAVEVCFVYFMFPETSGRTLEELAFLFEPKELSDKAVAAVDRIIHDPRSPISEKDEKAEKGSV